MNAASGSRGGAASMLERSFAHCYETGGMRRLHLRGQGNIRKRAVVHAAGFNLGLVMRKLLGAGTPRGFAALLLLFCTRFRHDGSVAAGRSREFWRSPKLPTLPSRFAARPPRISIPANSALAPRAVRRSGRRCAGCGDRRSAAERDEAHLTRITVGRGAEVNGRGSCTVTGVEPAGWKWVKASRLVQSGVGGDAGSWTARSEDPVFPVRPPSMNSWFRLPRLFCQRCWPGEQC